MILEVGSHAWKINFELDVLLFEECLWSDSRKLQDLRRVNSTGGDNHFPFGEDLAVLVAFPGDILWFVRLQEQIFFSAPYLHSSRFLVFQYHLTNCTALEKVVIGSRLDNTIVVSGPGV